MSALAADSTARKLIVIEEQTPSDYADIEGLKQDKLGVTSVDNQKTARRISVLVQTRYQLAHCGNKVRVTSSLHSQATTCSINAQIVTARKGPVVVGLKLEIS